MSTTTQGFTVPIANPEPVRPSAALAVWGILLGFVLAPIIAGIAYANLYSYSYWSGSSVNGGASFGLFCASLIALTGLIMLTVAINRALSTLDRIGLRIIGAGQVGDLMSTGTSHPTAPAEPPAVSSQP